MVSLERRGLLTVTAFAGLLIFTTVHAAETATIVANEVIVTGSLEDTVPQDLAKLGHDLVTVSNQIIKDKSYLDVSSALQFEVPGLYLAQRAGPFSYVDLSLQGSRSQDVLWTVDGVRINNRLYSTTAPTDTLPASMIERIEVLKGGESLFFGTQGVAGTINLVTRSFSDRFGGEMTLHGDTNSGRHMDGLIRGAAGQHRYVLFASQDKSDGFVAYDVYQPSATARKRPYDLTTAGLKYEFALNRDLALSMSYIHTDAEIGYPGARLTSFSQNTRDENIVSAKLDYSPITGPQFYVKAYHHDWDSHYTTINNVVGQSGAKVTTDNNLFWGYDDTGLNILGKLPVGKVDLLLGYDFQTFEGRDEVLIIKQVAENVHAVFGQVSTNLGFNDSARFSAGFRYNKTGETTATVWNVSGRFDITPAIFVQTNLGTGFNLPTAEQLFAVDPDSTLGNTTLKPEQSRSINLSVGVRTGNNIEWLLTGFGRQVDNLITFSTDLKLIPASVRTHPSFSSSGEAYINLGDANFSGYEALASLRLANNMKLSGSYTRSKATNRQTGLQLDRTPKQFAKAQLVWDPDQGRIGASASAIWTGDVFGTVSGAVTAYNPDLLTTRINYGDYVVIDLSAHAYLDETRKHRLTFSLQNVFDEAYVTRVNSGAVDVPSPTMTRFVFQNRGVPRTFHASYSYTF